MKVKFKKFRETAVMPKKGTVGSVAYDLILPEECYISPLERQVVPLGFGIEMDFGYEAKIEPRSGHSLKGMVGTFTDEPEHLLRFDCDVMVGKIDPDYKGEVGVILSSRDSQPFIIPKGTAIAQLTFYKVEEVEFDEVSELSESKRGNGGFGSTDN